MGFRRLLRELKAEQDHNPDPLPLLVRPPQAQASERQPRLRSSGPERSTDSAWTGQVMSALSPEGHVAVH